MKPFVKDTIELKCHVNVDRGILSHVMDMAIDGSMHWVTQMAKFSNAEPERSITDALLDGMAINVTDGIRGNTYELSAGKLLTGMMNYLECATPPDGDFLEWVDHELRVDKSYITEQIGDSILQYALFGQNRYRDGIEM